MGNARAFLSIVLIISIGIGFYITLKSFAYNLENITENYINIHGLADYTIYGSAFSEDDVDILKEMTHIKEVAPRVTIDTRYNDSQLRIMSLPLTEEPINVPFYYDGRSPENGELAICRKYAKEHELNLGDEIIVQFSDSTISLIISGIIASPEYIYLSQSSSVPLASSSDFGIGYVHGQTLLRENIQYNEIIMLFDGDVDRGNVIRDIHSTLQPGKIQNAITKENQINYSSYAADIDQVNSMAYVFPMVFLLIGSTMIYVLQKRNVVQERKQIGIQKALGYGDYHVLQSFLKYGLLLSVLGSILGLGLYNIFGQFILTAFQQMLEIPGLELELVTDYWLIGSSVALVVTAFSNIIAVKQITKINPAEAMHAEKPKDGKSSLLEKIPGVWNKLSFNSRYALKTALRNKGRFIAVILGMVATLSLTLFSLGFGDSLEHLVDRHYTQVVNYDLLVEVEPRLIGEESLLKGIDNVSTYHTALLAPMKISKGEMTVDISILVSKRDFNALKLEDNKGNRIHLDDNGAILPLYYAERLNVKIGDTIKVATLDGQSTFEVEISNISDQGTSFYAYLTYEYLNNQISDDLSFYNVLFVTTEGEYNNTSEEIRGLEKVKSVASAESEKDTLLQLMSIIDILVFVLVCFAIVLGITVLYSVSAINLTARTYEFNLLSVMGYSTSNIMLAYIKETILQVLISIPFGYIGGMFILSAIKEEFSNEFFVMKDHIYPSSYFYSLMILILVIVITKLLAIRYIEKLDIVQGLKAREE